MSIVERDMVKAVTVRRGHVTVTVALSPFCPEVLSIVTLALPLLTGFPMPPPISAGKSYEIFHGAVLASLK